MYDLIAKVIIIAAATSGVHSHGRLMEPPARNTMWRFGFDTPPNYEDTQLFCGGIKVQWEDNHGKCGVCGDSYSGVRHHETGGIMARNITSRVYAPGGQIDVLIDIIANHAGRFSFGLCYRQSADEPETEECFQPLRLVTGKEYLDMPTDVGKTGFYSVAIQLPPAKKCAHCVFRWHWKSANNWGRCENGTQAVGCGPQETYRNCADIAIDPSLIGVRGPEYNRRAIYNDLGQRDSPNKWR